MFPILDKMGLCKNLLFFHFSSNAVFSQVPFMQHFLTHSKMSPLNIS